ncbi:MAG: rod shape-determining protein RodA, partial [Treponema sp.]|nr:rod shape-determining protein RodA [Treponema sp.]
FAALVLLVIGILFIYSSGITSEGIQISTEYRRQILWAAAGLIIALLVAVFNFRRIYDLSIYLYLAVIILLLYTSIFGRVVHGTRWLRFGSFGIQVSEFAKITTILFLAWYLDNTKRNKKIFTRFIVSCLIVMVPMIIVLIQPDLGTSIVFIPILLGMTFIAGISLRYIIFLGVTIILSAILLVLPLWQTAIMNNSIPALMLFSSRRFVLAGGLSLLLIALIAWFGFIRYQKKYFFWICYGAGIMILSLGISFVAQKVLREYQIMRLIVFMNPNVDPRGSGWHIIQSITAIGSGGVFGKGYLQGTQSHYRFLPEQSTDFIFSILSEEWGFFGGIFVFVLFLIINLRLIRIMTLTTDYYGLYIVAGLSSMFIFHFFINVGMTMGIMPITGIPLMLVSYGGSSVITAMTGIGLAMSVHVRRFQR